MNLLKLKSRVAWLEFISRKQGEGMNRKHDILAKDLFESLHTHRNIVYDKIDRIEWFNVGHWAITCILGYSAWSNYLDLKTLNKDIERRNA